MKVVWELRRVLTLKNKRLLSLLAATFRLRRIRRSLIAGGERLDVPFPAEAGIVEPRPLTEEEKRADWIAWPLPRVASRREKKELRDFEDDAMMASLRGVFVPRIKDRIFWRVQAAAGLVMTLAPLVLAGLGAAEVGVGLPPPAWLLAFGLIEAIHIAELPFSLRAHARRAERLKLRPRKGRRILATLVIGYPAWVPYARGVFD